MQGSIRMFTEEHMKEGRFTSKNKENPYSISNSCFDYTPSGKNLANILPDIYPSLSIQGDF
jgi:hypothetical protein